MCICFKQLDLSQKTGIAGKTCIQPCPNDWTNDTCGSSDIDDIAYYDVYQHKIGKIFKRQKTYMYGAY